MLHSQKSRKTITLTLIALLSFSYFALIQPTHENIVSTATIACAGTISGPVLQNPFFSSGWENSGGTDITDGGLWTYILELAVLRLLPSLLIMGFMPASFTARTRVATVTFMKT